MGKKISKLGHTRLTRIRIKRGKQKGSIVCRWTGRKPKTRAQKKPRPARYVGMRNTVRYISNKVNINYQRRHRMTRRVFFSFKYEDVSRANVVRNSWVTQGKEAAGFIDAADFENLEKQGDTAIKNWIDKQLEGTSVTVVLVGEKTCSSRWVKYEIKKSIERGNGLLGIDISKIKDLQGNTSERCGRIPEGYSFYLWNKDEGYENMGDWIGKAAPKAGK